MGMGHRKTSLTLYGMSITITVTPICYLWAVNINVYSGIGSSYFAWDWAQADS